MNEAQREFALAAIDHFETWSNVLLVATTGALGWVSTSKDIRIKPSAYYSSVYLFALSIMFGIFTLALIPLVTEGFLAQFAKLESPPSFYNVEAEFNLPWSGQTRMKIKCVCFPQHYLFLAGILVYSLGVRATQGESTRASTCKVVFGSTVLLAIFFLSLFVVWVSGVLC